MEKSTVNNTLEHTQKLSILIAQGGLSFCITSADAVIKFEEKLFSEPQNPENLLQEIQTVFSHSFAQNLSAISSVQVFFAHQLYALVPRDYFDTAHLSDYLKFSTRLLPTDELVFDRLMHTAANLVYIPYTNINNFLVEKFGEFTYQHATTHFLDQCLESLSSDGEIAFINVYRTHFDLCAFKDKTLLLCNSYEYSAPEDLVYYALFAFNQLKLAPEKLTVFLGGLINKDMKLYQLLYAYIQQLNFYVDSSPFTIQDSGLKQLAPHRYSFFLNSI